MRYYFASIITGIAALFGFSSSNCNNQPKDVASTPHVYPPDTIKIFTREKIIEKLKELSESKAPDTLAEGAMCYKVAGPPNRAEYVCPSCGAKTIYTSDAWTITRDIPQCRSIVADLKAYDIKLDESQFCKKCSPKQKDPQLCIEIKFTNEKDEHKTCSISPFDLQLLSEFLKGSQVHRGDTGEETPLKNYIDRIKTILDIK